MNVVQQLWFAEGPVEEKPGLWRIPLPLGDLGLRAVNVYLIDDGDTFTLVDCGTGRDESIAALDRALEQLRIPKGAIRRVVSTHVHHDHFGQARRLQATYGARLFLGAGERPSLRALQTGRADEQLWCWERVNTLGDIDLAMTVRERPADPFWTTQSPETWGEPDVWLHDGDTIPGASRTLRTLSTPGHTAGHISLGSADDRWLFAGDHILPRLTPSIGSEPIRNPNALNDFLRSLIRVRSLPVSIVWPAHGAPFPGLTERVQELIAHHDARLRACVAAVSRNGVTVADVAAELPWTRKDVRYGALDEFNRMLALYETAAHLTLLRAAGVIDAADHKVPRHDGSVAAYPCSDRRYGLTGAAMPATMAELLEQTPQQGRPFQQVRDTP